MVSVSVFVGLDYHDDSIRVCIMDEEGEVLWNRDVVNDVRRVADSVTRYGHPAGVAIEACCGAASFAAELSSLTGWCVRQAHPLYVSQLKKSRDKTDFGDARLLADLLRVGYLPDVWLPDLDTRQLRRLVRQRQSLANDRRKIKLRIRSVLRDDRVVCPNARPWTAPWLKWLQSVQLPEESRWVMDQLLAQLAMIQKWIADAERRLDEVTCEDRVCVKLRELPGVGLITAVTLRAEIGHFERFHSGKKLACFCGVSPRNASSGKRQADAGLNCESNPALRAVLIQTAWRLPRCDSRWRDLRDRLKKAKPANVVTAAIANRWVRWLYHQMVVPVTEVSV